MCKARGRQAREAGKLTGMGRMLVALFLGGVAEVTGCGVSGALRREGRVNLRGSYDRKPTRQTLGTVLPTEQQWGLR